MATTAVPKPITKREKKRNKVKQCYAALVDALIDYTMFETERIAKGTK
jgi:hypothetical protein